MPSWRRPTAAGSRASDADRSARSRRHRGRASLASHSGEQTMTTASINGLKHNWVDEGPADAPAIVFQHGANGSHHQFTEEHTPTIAKKYRCISDDARGLGGSEHVATMPPTAWVDD